MRHEKILKLTLLLILFIFSLNFVWITNLQAQIEPGEKAPGFKLLSLDGREIALENFLGKIVILHLWKCKWNQCRAEIPHLLEIKKQYDPEKVVILSINVLDQEGQVKAEVEKYKMDYTVLVGRDMKTTEHYKVKKLPHLVIINKEGIIHTSKRFLKADKIKEALDSLLTD